MTRPRVVLTCNQCRNSIPTGLLFYVTPSEIDILIASLRSAILLFLISGTNELPIETIIKLTKLNDTIIFFYLTFFLFARKIRRAKTLAYLPELSRLFSPSAYRNALRFVQLTNRELSRSIVSKYETGGGRSRGDCAPLISILNIHESKRVRGRERE